MKKLFVSILLVISFLFIPNIYAEENLYELDFYKYEGKTWNDITGIDMEATDFLNKYMFSYDNDNYGYSTYYDGKLLFKGIYDEELDDNKLEISENTEVYYIDYIFNNEEKNNLYYYESLQKYDGIKLVLKETEEFISDKECTSVCIDKLIIDDSSSLKTNKSNPTFDGLQLDLDLSFDSVGEFVKYKVNLNNPTDKDYEIGTEDKFSDSDYIKYEYTFDNDDNVLKAKSEKTMYVTVRYNKVVPEEEMTDGIFKEENNAVIKLSNGVEETPLDNNPVEKVDVPDTYTGISIFIVFALIAGLGYISYNKLSGKMMLLFIPLLLIPVIVNAYERLEVKVNTKVEIKEKINILEKRYAYSGERDFWQYHESIKTITFLNEIKEPQEYENIYDVSDKKDRSVIAYLVVNEEDENLYDLYIMADGKIYANPDSSYLFASMEQLTNINNMQYFDTRLAIDMSRMFYYCNSLKDIDLSYFDTSNVTDMSHMFHMYNYKTTLSKLDVSSFDTSKVTDMSYMFNEAGSNNANFTLNLGSNFNTSNVTNMEKMFNLLAYNSTTFTLDLGDKFDTSNVTNMSHMFGMIGQMSSIFTLDLGDKFDTSNVTNMGSMFNYIGENNPDFTLDLGDKFDTSKVTNMDNMFIGCDTLKAIYVGMEWDTSKVTSSDYMFIGCPSLPNYDSNKTDKTNAHTGPGGYLTLKSE